MSQTYNPSKVRRARKHGFRARRATPGGRNVILRRRRKGRKRIAVQTRYRLPISARSRRKKNSV